MGSNHKKKRIEIHKTHPYVQHKKEACEECGVKQSDGAQYDENGFLIRKGRQGNALTVHHIDHNPYNNDPSNLQTPCRKCHEDKHKPYA